MIRTLILILALVPLWVCKSTPPVSFRSQAEQINLNSVRMITKAEAKQTDKEGKKLGGDPTVAVETSEKGQSYIQLDLVFEDSGLNIIEEIIAGKILEHYIIALNHKGEVISKQPVNFQAFEVTETKTEKVRNKVIANESKEPITLKKEDAETTTHREATERQYTDKDSVPQVLVVFDGKTPKTGDYISIFLELTYIHPILEPGCDSLTKACDQTQKSFFAEIAARNRSELDKLKEKYLNGHIESFPNLKDKELETLKLGIKGNIERKNGMFGIKEPSKYNYREWKLVSAPRFFKIVPNNGKPVVIEEKTEDKKETQDQDNDRLSDEPGSIFEAPTHSIHKKRQIFTP
ncbi:hypothetical protein P3G55_16220 [Leptospira sp. 96542]|nr:hypothetical protein [Leptospira sp. 96542]